MFIYLSVASVVALSSVWWGLGIGVSTVTGTLRGDSNWRIHIPTNGSQIWQEKLANTGIHLIFRDKNRLVKVKVECKMRLSESAGSIMGEGRPLPCIFWYRCSACDQKNEPNGIWWCQKESQKDPQTRKKESTKSKFKFSNNRKSYIFDWFYMPTLAQIISGTNW